jgi:hypothetical protein
MSANRIDYGNKSIHSEKKYFFAGLTAFTGKFAINEGELMFHNITDPMVNNMAI